MDRKLSADDRGFTLIELMVAVAVLALLTTTVTLSLSRPRAEGKASDWARFAAAHERMRHDAILSRAMQALAIGPDGYRPLRRTAGAWQEDGPEHPWRAPVSALAPSGRQIILAAAPDGRVTPFRLRFDDGERICASDGAEPVTCARN